MISLLIKGMLDLLDQCSFWQGVCVCVCVCVCVYCTRVYVVELKEEWEMDYPFPKYNCSIVLRDCKESSLGNVLSSRTRRNASTFPRWRNGLSVCSLGSKWLRTKPLAVGTLNDWSGTTTKAHAYTQHVCLNVCHLRVCVGNTLAYFMVVTI